ncbi:MAG: ribonuclease HII, partial [Candidatus Paceibacterota bacterium]
PVYVGLVIAPVDFDFGIFANLDDSKKMTERRRLEIFTRLKSSSDLPVRAITSFSKTSTIDKLGIVPAIQQAINRGLRRFSADADNSYVYLDGSLKAPENFDQETIIGGDGLIPAISLASVIAKVARDQHMQRISESYPEYRFAQHKGYGTKSHREAIKEYGASAVHRHSFLANLI